MKISHMVIAGTLLFAAAMLSAQEQQVQRQSTSSSRSETSVESAYLNDADGTIIMGLAASDEYDNKLVALEYLQTAISNSNTSDQVIAALDQLAGEGLTTQARQRNRLMNNYPDIRREACLLMAKVPTEHTKNTLVQITVAESEPMVIAAAVRSLGEIGLNNNDEVVDAICYANRRNQVMNPTSSLALEVLNALEKLAPTTENKRAIIDTAASIASDYHYVAPVRKRALAILKTLGTGSSSSASSNTSSN
ncbi:MAG: HEAT repeat domain-containing protein [Treponema sp.]|nr:HEAT repeat domain-containing protein [Treponema sp.]